MRATAIVGGASVITLALSVLTSKVFALLIGPVGVGSLGLLQSILNIAAIAFGLGISTVVIRQAASRRDPEARRTEDASAVALAAALGGIGAVLIILYRDVLARMVLGSAERSDDVALVGLALALSMISAVIIAMLTGRHLVRAVALVNVGSSVAAAAVGIPLVMNFGAGGLAPMIFITALAQFTFASIALGRWVGLKEILRRPAWPQVRRMASRGAPLAAAQLVGGGIQLGIPILVLHLLGAADVGMYRAAAMISVGYLTFFLATLTQDFFPRLAATEGSRAMGVAIERRMRLLMGMGAPIILGMIAASPMMITLLYSGEFSPSADLLRWQLIGDLLRLPAWVLGFGLISRGLMRRHFLVELGTGVLLFAVSAVAIEALGLEGAGIGYAIAQLGHAGALWIAIVGVVDTRPGRLQASLLALAAGSAVILLLRLPPELTTIVFATAAVALALVAWPMLWRLHLQRQL